MEFQHPQIYLKVISKLITNQNNILTFHNIKHMNLRLNWLSILAEFVIPTSHGERPIVDIKPIWRRTCVFVNTGQRYVEFSLYLCEEEILLRIDTATEGEFLFSLFSLIKTFKSSSAGDTGLNIFLSKF